VIDKQELSEHFKELVSRHAADLKSQQGNKIKSLERKHAASDTFFSGMFQSKIIDVHINCLDDTLKSVFTTAEETISIYSLAYDEWFHTLISDTLDCHYAATSTSIAESLETYFGKFGDKFNRSLTASILSHKLPLIEVWYKNNLRIFAFKEKHKAKHMTNSTINISGNKNVVTTTTGSNNTTSISITTDDRLGAVESIESIIKHLSSNEAAIDSRNDIISCLSEAKDEVAKKSPNKFKIQSLLKPCFQVINKIPELAGSIEKTIESLKKLDILF